MEKSAALKRRAVDDSSECAKSAVALNRILAAKQVTYDPKLLSYELSVTSNY